MAHYLPVSTGDAALATPELLYVNGKALLDPFPQGSVDKMLKTKHHSRFFNMKPTHVTARYRRDSYPVPNSKQNLECVHDQGTMPLPLEFRRLLLRRRFHYLAAATGLVDPLSQCLSL
ncbi:hypothetical protein PINS_up023667 [Pythium insidiosum]|nr:hypothetical protein PINS_up002644 [Pythium insidiosum]GLE11301.1 hypothetical protein PINS_up023667 [Pythium insidiosum]